MLEAVSKFQSKTKSSIYRDEIKKAAFSPDDFVDTNIDGFIPV